MAFLSIWWPAFGLVLGVLWMARKMYLARKPRLDFPSVGDPKNLDIPAALREGMEKYPTTPFVLPLPEPEVIMPMHLFKEVMHADRKTISFRARVRDMFLGDVLDIGNFSHGAMMTIRSDLTRQLGKDVLPLLQREIHANLAKNFVGGSPEAQDDWQDIPLLGKLIRLNTVLMSSLFVGHPLCDDEEWLGLAMGYTGDMGTVLRQSRKWMPWMRPLVGPFLSSVRRVKGNTRKAERILAPLIQERLAEAGSCKAGDVEIGSRGTVLAWLVNRVHASEKTIRWLTYYQLQFAFASIHTTSSTGWNVFADLAVRPQYIQPLLDELDEAVAADGWATTADGQRILKKHTIGKLDKLDSFIRESQRVNLLSYINCTRKVVQQVTLSDGTVLPRNATIAFPIHAISRSTSTLPYSTAINAQAGNLDSTQFDGFRFSRLRNLPGKEAKYQAGTTGEDHFVFGHGPESCPGRFFALYVIKCLVIEMIRNWEFKMAGDESGEGGEELRPKPYVAGSSLIPNPTAMMAIRRKREKEKV